MSLLSRKKSSVPATAPTDSWTVVQSTYDGSPLLARVRTDLGAFLRHPAYPFRVGVATRLTRPTASGMPDPEENETLLEIETGLAAALEAERSAILVVALTTNGIKEWVFYASDPQAIKTRMETFAASVCTHELQLAIEQDPDWTVYHQFAQSP